MNIENAKTLVGQLKRLPDEKFWMPDYIVHPDHFHFCGITRAEDCGTVACVAGWACLANGGPTKDVEGDAHKWARDWLGLGVYEANHLFRGRWAAERPLSQVTRSEAIAELERMIEAERVSA